MYPGVPSQAATTYGTFRTARIRMKQRTGGADCSAGHREVRRRRRRPGSVGAVDRGEGGTDGCGMRAVVRSGKGSMAKTDRGRGDGSRSERRVSG